ncbi:uncharacterized protein LOC116846363 isoform X2 [Odontomachus brunneus]|uniref:uncharacterized protein LOC116846363 isoform X2 n=1 Tax=Odontomachus brunneus TaxID=486640 RepID=UPI0013F2373B|nr:uncharacterized protein LOC116846363 isoform X2 [Odontomachus brunneus]
MPSWSRQKVYLLEPRSELDEIMPASSPAYAKGFIEGPRDRWGRMVGDITVQCSCLLSSRHNEQREIGLGAGAVDCSRFRRKVAKFPHEGVGGDE